jgi:ABC-type proline/glycine betaine transport system ATPase subunit
MSKFLLTVCAFGLLLSSAFAEEKSREQYREERLHIFGIEGQESQSFTKFVASGAKQRIGFYAALNPDCTAVVMSTSVSPNNPNMARWKL